MLQIRPGGFSSFLTFISKTYFYFPPGLPLWHLEWEWKVVNLFPKVMTMSGYENSSLGQEHSWHLPHTPLLLGSMGMLVAMLKLCWAGASPTPGSYTDPLCLGPSRASSKQPGCEEGRFLPRQHCQAVIPSKVQQGEDAGGGTGQRLPQSHSHSWLCLPCRMNQPKGHPKMDPAQAGCAVLPGKHSPTLLTSTAPVLDVFTAERSKSHSIECSLPAASQPPVTKRGLDAFQWKWRS